MSHDQPTGATALAPSPATPRTALLATPPATDPAARSNRHEALAGARAMLPWLAAIMPFGMVVGMTAASGRAQLVGLATGPTIYGGSAQLTAMGLLESGAGAAVVVASVLAINARLLFYGAAMAPHWAGAGRGFRALAAYLLVDPSYAVGLRRYAVQPRGAHAYYVGAGVTLWAAWHGAMLAGWRLGAGVPSWMPVEDLVPLFLLAEVAQAARTGPASCAALVAAVVGVFGAGLPLHSSLLIGVVLGVLTALAVGRRSRS